MMRLASTPSRLQAGDTIVEVIFGLAIMTIVLVSSFAAVNKAFLQGETARERSVVSNLLQQQAEALRSYRDSKPDDWATVYTAINVVTGSFTAPFHMVKSGPTGWLPASGALTTGIYTIELRALPVSVGPLGADSPDAVTGFYDRLKFDFAAVWINRGQPSNQISEFSTTLASLENLKPCRNNTAGSAACDLGGGPVIPPSTTYTINNTEFCESATPPCGTPGITSDIADPIAPDGTAKQFNDMVPVRAYSYAYNDSISSITIHVKNELFCPIPINWNVTINGVIVGSDISTDDVNYQPLTFSVARPIGPYVLGVTFAGPDTCGAVNGYFDDMVVQS